MMALYSNDPQFILDLPWKTFLKETPAEHEQPVDNYVFELNFKGEEAKNAYEEIIKQTVDNSTKHENEFLRIKIVKTVQRKQQCENITTVTVNTILKAVEQHDLKFLQKHVNSENVNSSDDFGWTPLMSAAYCGYLEIVEFLLTLGANKRMRDKSGLTAAQLALKKNYLSTVALLRKKHEYTGSTVSFTLEPRKANPPNTLLLSEEITSLQGQIEPSNNGTHSSKKQSDQNGSFFCDICQENFKEIKRKHECSTLHIFNTKPKIRNAFYGLSKQNKGYQILLNTGWDEEDGLGPTGKGMKYPVKTLFKIDRKGIGYPGEKEARVTHFKSGDINAINTIRAPKQKPLKKKDREKLLNREARKERALRIALS